MGNWLLPPLMAGQVRPRYSGATCRFVVCFLALVVRHAALSAAAEDPSTGGGAAAGGGQRQDRDGGQVQRLSLQDDPVFQPKKYQKNVEEDPQCSRDLRWSQFRESLIATPPQQRIDLAYEKTMEWGLENATLVDEQAKICIMGIITLQYLFADFLLLEVGSVEAATHSFRLMDSQTGALHPDLFDKAAGNGQTWPITAAQVDSIRRKILRSSVGGGAGGADRRRRFRSGFGLHDGDWEQVWNWQRKLVRRNPVSGSTCTNLMISQRCSSWHEAPRFANITSGAWRWRCTTGSLHAHAARIIPMRPTSSSFRTTQHA